VRQSDFCWRKSSWFNIGDSANTSFGIVSLFLFYAVARRTVSRDAIPIALGLFAVAPPLIYYIADLKQYSSDVAISLFLYFVAFSATPPAWSKLRIAALGLIGAIAVWLSHPAVFVVAGIGVVFFFVLITQRQWKQLAGFAVAYALVLGSWLVDYWGSLRSLAGDHYLLSYWAKAFAPFPPKSASELRWFI
jgi:hypothetical protein